MHRLSYKTILPTAAVIPVASVLLWLTGFPISPWIVGGLTLSVAVVAWYTHRVLIEHHVVVAEEALNYLTEHRFEELRALTNSGNREFDALIELVKQTGIRYEKEIDSLQSIENYRRKFLGNVSHELKTPIFAILGYSDTLLEGAIDDESVSRKFVEKISRNADRLQNLVRDLTEISRLESGEQQLEMAPFDFRSILLEVVDSLENVGAKSGVTLKVGASESLPQTMGNAQSIRQVLVNLIDNAIKYTDRDGKVMVSARPVGPDLLRIAVADSGIGISESDIGRITERFFRVDQSRSRALGGTGLGLAIVKHLLAAHEQMLTVQSEEGKGSTFSFCLPISSDS